MLQLRAAVLVRFRLDGGVVGLCSGRVAFQAGALGSPFGVFCFGCGLAFVAAALPFRRASLVRSSVWSRRLAFQAGAFGSQFGVVPAA